MSRLSLQIQTEARRQLPRTLARTLWLQSHLAIILQAAAQKGMQVIVLKGAALCETVYPQLGLRDFRDIDLLIHSADLSLARHVLEGQGFLPDPVHWSDLIQGQDSQADFALDTPGGAVVVELHTDFINNDLLKDQIAWNEEAVWNRASLETLAGKSALVLGAEDQLLHLCLHLAGHYLAAPRSLWDIACVCAAQGIDWPQLITLAEEGRLKRMTFIGLWLAANLMDAPIPPTVLERLSPRHPQRLQFLALARAQDLTGRRTTLLRLPLLLLLCDNPQRLPRLLMRLLLPSRRWRHDHRISVKRLAPPSA